MQGNDHLAIIMAVDGKGGEDVLGNCRTSIELFTVYISSAHTTIGSIITITSLFLMHRVYAVQEHILVYIHTAHVRHQQ